jgi:hypothetical protein
MRLRMLAATVVAAFLVSSGAAKAAMFGTQEDIHPIQDIPYQVNQNEPLFLGYKTSTLYVFAGVYVKDDGYVLGVKSDSTHYYDLPTGDELKQLQADGLLPNPLPPYSIGIVDYLLGYSLWIALAIIVAVYVIGWLRKRGQPAAPTPSPPTPAA